MKTIRINVTQRDIDEARKAIAANKGRAMHCPLARAIQRHKGFSDVSVGTHECGRSHIDRESIRLPDTACNWRGDFDRDRNVKPFSFNLEVPE